MKFVYDYLKIKAGTPSQTAHLLTMHTGEVDRVSNGVVAKGVVTGKVIDVQKHPNADRLQIVTIDIITEILDIITGAPNIEANQIIAFAPVGSSVLFVDHKNPSPDLSSATLTKIQPTMIRGIESRGMICGADELGISNETNSEAYVFHDETKVGIPIETVIDSIGSIETDDKGTAHRPDLLSYRGIEYELSAILSKQVAINTPKLPPIINNNSFSLKIDQNSGCELLIVAKIDNIKISKSPKWLIEFLMKHDLKTINLPTDITNYIMLREGHPTHVFASNAVGEKLIARRAKKNESLIALDNKTYQLEVNDLVLANDHGPLDIAGIIGGETSKVTGEASSILLTCAVFDPVIIRQTARRLRIRTDASARFERGLSHASAINAFSLCLDLIINETGGEVSLVNVAGDVKVLNHKIKFEPERINLMLGLELTNKSQLDILQRLHYTLYDNYISPPWWRSDVLGIADVAEDIARIYGYTLIPVGNSRFNNNATDSSLIDTVNKLREASAVRLYEVQTPTMTSANSDGSIEVANPIGNMRFVRQSQISEVLKIADHFNRLGYDDYGCFEIGKTYRFVHNKVIEKHRFNMCVAINPENAKTIMGHILHRIHVDTSKIKFISCPQTDTRSIKYDAVAHVKYDNILLGHLIVHIVRGTQYCVFKLYIDVIDRIRNHNPKYQAYSKFPNVKRDISVFVASKINIHDINKSIDDLSEIKSLIDSPPIITKFSGHKIQDGQKAITIGLNFRSPSRTLTDLEVNKMIKIVESMLEKEYNATIR